MQPYAPFAALPVAVIAAWLAAPNASVSAPGRYQIPPVKQIEDPSAPMAVRSQSADQPDIRLQAFLPHVPPRPAVPVPTLILNSVMTSKYVRVASINGRTVKEGGRVAGYEVRRIAADGVLLARGHEIRRLPMRPLYELPPPARPGAAAVHKAAVAQRGKADLTQDFWKVFDSLKP